MKLKRIALEDAVPAFGRPLARHTRHLSPLDRMRGSGYPSKTEVVASLGGHSLWTDPARGLLVGHRKARFDSGALERDVHDIILLGGGPNDIDGVLPHLRRTVGRGSRTLHARIPATDVDTMRLLLGCGFRIRSSLLGFRLETAKAEPPLVGRRHDVRVRVSGRDDTAVLDIAASSFRGRYDNDPSFDPAMVRRYYREWASNCLHGRTQHNLVLESGGRTVAFAAMMSKVMGRLKVASLDLIAVDEGHRGQGYAASILARALCDLWGSHDCFTLHTGADNARTIDLFMGLGYRPVNIIHSLHMSLPA